MWPCANKTLFTRIGGSWGPCFAGSQSKLLCYLDFCLCPVYISAFVWHEIIIITTKGQQMTFRFLFNRFNSFGSTDGLGWGTFRSPDGRVTGLAQAPWWLESCLCCSECDAAHVGGQERPYSCVAFFFLNLKKNFFYSFCHTKHVGF